MVMVHHVDRHNCKQLVGDQHTIEQHADEQHVDGHHDNHQRCITHNACAQHAYGRHVEYRDGANCWCESATARAVDLQMVVFFSVE